MNVVSANFIEDGIIISLQWNFYLIMFEHFICVYIKEIDFAYLFL